MPNILLTGGAGFVGSAMARRLAQLSTNQITIVDNLRTGRVENIPTTPFDNIKFIKCDVNRLDDISGVFYSGKFDYVFHFAALVGVQRTLNNPVKVLEDIDGIRNVLNLSKNTGVQRIFYSSSSEVYGEPFEIPQNEETTPLNSRLPYAIVKNVGESYLRAFEREFGLDYTIFRFFNTYGVQQSDDFVMSKFIRAALNNQPITLFGDGLQTRTFCNIMDNVDACFEVYAQNSYINDVINIGSDDEITIKDLAEMIIQICDSSSEIIHLPALEEGDMRRRRPDNSKMKSILNRELIPIHEGIQEIVDSLRTEEHVRN
jgi:UDP-glucuronate decarboxylase